MVDFTDFTRTARLEHSTLPGYSAVVKGSPQSKHTCLEDHDLHFIRASAHDFVREISLSSSIGSTYCNESNSVIRHINPQDNYLSPNLELHAFVYHGCL